jgi:chromosome partitioning protein
MIPVMRGRLEDFDLANVLQVVSLSRQYTVVSVRDPKGQTVGTVSAKSGMVVAATSRHGAGLKALAQVMHQKCGEFDVARGQMPIVDSPMGPVSTLLMRIATNGGNGNNNGHANGATKATPAQSFAAVMAPPDEATQASGPPAPPPLPKLPLPSVPPRRPDLPVAVPAPVAAPATIANGSSAPAVAAVAVTGLNGSAPPAANGGIPATMNGTHTTPATMRTSVPVVPNGGEAGLAPLVCVTSPKGGVGKTTLALNTSVALARLGWRVCLVDADPNGGVVAAVNAQERRTRGLYDVLVGQLELSSAIVQSKLPGLSIIPAGGVELPNSQIEETWSKKPPWTSLFGRLRRWADVVIIDPPAGLHGAGRLFLGAATHTLAVLQAEPIAMRSFAQFRRALESLPLPRPVVAGVILNMLDARSPASVNVLQEACKMMPADWLFEVPIPRSAVFAEAGDAGVPLALLDKASAPPIAYVFETVAIALAQRIGLATSRIEASPFL